MQWNLPNLNTQGTKSVVQLTDIIIIIIIIMGIVAGFRYFFKGCFSRDVTLLCVGISSQVPFSVAF